MEECKEIPACVFLAGFDPLMLGYEKTENPFLPSEHLRGVFSLAGIVQPSVLLRGRVVGRWKRSGKKLSVTLFERISTLDVSEIRYEAMRLWPELTRIEGLELE